MKTLNQAERTPMRVEEQVVQIYAATNGHLDRITVDKVERFLAELIEMVRGSDPELLRRSGAGTGATRPRPGWPRSWTSSPRTSASTSTKRATRSIEGADDIRLSSRSEADAQQPVEEKEEQAALVQ